ncbi:nicotinamidase-like [Rhopilema esculentum]|uniref:nicotinamidase-like n=1 Tax=Rhopilema esculentum TaxID=499914 RepID=UPI0031D55E33|eukprot:gene1329-15727_t
MAWNMKEVTTYFDVFRQSNVDLNEQNTKDVLKRQNITRFKYWKDVPVEDLGKALKDLANGEDCKLSADQLNNIIQALTHHSLQGKIDADMWNSCVKYWARKDISEKSALIAVDVQNDFISGSLALKNQPAKEDGAEIVPVINKLKQDVKFDLIVFTLDWHPSDHCSYHTNVKMYPFHETCKIKADHAKMYDFVIYGGDKPQEQILWPVHCEQGSWGAKLHEDLQIEDSALMVHKGSIPAIDSYSAFWDNGKLSQTNLFTTLLQHNITKVFICGLATDFCVAFSAVDAANHGLTTFLIEDACRGVSEESIKNARANMKDAGVTIINTNQVLELL